MGLWQSKSPAKMLMLGLDAAGDIYIYIYIYFFILTFRILKKKRDKLLALLGGRQSHQLPKTTVNYCPVST